MPAKHGKRHNQRKGKTAGSGGGQRLSVSIPPTPNSAGSENSKSAAPQDNNSTPQDPQSDLASPFQTPPTSPSSPVTELPTIDAVVEQEITAMPPISGNDVAPKEDLATLDTSVPEQATATPPASAQDIAPKDDLLMSNPTLTPPTSAKDSAQKDDIAMVDTSDHPTPTSAKDTTSKDDNPIIDASNQSPTATTPPASAKDTTSKDDNPIIDASNQSPTTTTPPASAKDTTHKDDNPMTDTSNQSQTTTTPPASAKDITPKDEPPTADAFVQPQATAIPPISANEIASQDIVAIAELFATMKKTLVTMTSAFDRLGSQTEKMVSFSLDIKAAEQLKQLPSALNEQIAGQKTEVDALRDNLESKIKAAIEEKMRTHLHEIVKDSLKETIKERVQQELSVQIPEDLRQQVISHQRQILEVKTALHNSEARRYNALQTTSNARLRPLLRPLPTPEQSPVVIISRTNSQGNSTLATPASAFPLVPAPTPIKRTTSNSFRTDRGPPTASALFPPDLHSLFALGPDDTRRLLREYGLVSASASPSTDSETPKHRGLPSVDEEAGGGSDADASGEEDPEAHAADMNKFMAHIGVPFLMIPPPKEKEDLTTPMSSRTRRHKMLTPLIIK